MIKNLSPSRASQFKTCPKQFEYANVIKITEPTNDVQAKGTTIHTALELLFDELPKNRTKDKLHKLFRNEWNNIRNDDEFSNLFTSKEEERAWGLDAYKLLSNYLQLEDPKEIEPVERERWVRGRIEDLNLRGILDRMDEDEDGNLVILDYKSGKAPSPKYKEPRFFALKLYALLIEQEIGKMPTELKLIYLKNSTVHSLKVNSQMLAEVRSEILGIWEDIKVSFENENFPAIKNTLCNWCYYKPICPAYNQDSPDTDILKDLSTKSDELQDTITALSMIKDKDSLPKSSDLYGLDQDNLKKEKEALDNERNALIVDFQAILGE